jgi:hypothetical protein
VSGPKQDDLEAEQGCLDFDASGRVGVPARLHVCCGPLHKCAKGRPGTACFVEPRSIILPMTAGEFFGTIQEDDSLIARLTYCGGQVLQG